MNPPDVYIRPDEIRVDFVRSSGPGGQNVNKVATAVQLRFDLRNSRSIGAEAKERLMKLAGRRVTSAGEIVIEARRFRTQQRNREDAMERLILLVQQALTKPAVRAKSRLNAASKGKRLQEKKRRSRLKQLRTHVAGDE